MSEPIVVDAPMTPGQAVREVLRIDQRADALLQRATGLTWMIWGCINAGIFVNYDAISLAGLSNGIAAIIWIPWLALGAILTTVLWRSLALAVRAQIEGSGWGTAAVIATFFVLTIGGIAIITLARIPVNPFAWAMLAVGLATAFVGGSGLASTGRSERVIWTVGGVGLAIIAVAISIISRQIGYDAGGLFMVLGPVASTTVLFGGGLYVASR